MENNNTIPHNSPLISNIEEKEALSRKKRDSCWKFLKISGY
jgi:hypothetical protein